MQLAPIVLFTYNRVGHARHTIEALKGNHLAAQSELIVFSDEAKTDEGKAKVREVREYLKRITGFLSVTVHERNENFGLARNILEGVTNVVQVHGKVIVLEDDLVTSKYFLTYMNDALVKYENEDKVISIHGYVYPVKGKLPVLFFLKGADCWGWATWKRGWDLMETDGRFLLDKLTNEKLAFRFNFFNTFPYVKMLEDQVAGKNQSWAIRWYASAFIKDRLTLYPGESLVRNIGNDDSGTHSRTTNQFDVVLADRNPDVRHLTVPLEDSVQAAREFARYFKTLERRIDHLKSFVRKLIFWK